MGSGTAHNTIKNRPMKWRPLRPETRNPAPLAQEKSISLRLRRRSQQALDSDEHLKAEDMLPEPLCSGPISS